MVRILLNNNRVYNWKKFGQGYVKGYAFIGMTLLTESDLYTQCLDAFQQGQLKELLYRLNGCFAIVLIVNGKTILAVDKLRKFTLFYCKTSTGYIVTDSGDTILHLYDSFVWNPIAVKEFISAGYISGNNTLLKDCYMVPAASYIYITDDRLTQTDYYSFSPLQSIDDKTNLNEQIDSILERVIQRMKIITQGQTVLIPLSGGYDSRLIACLCKKYNVPNVICYTYGIKDSPEIEISRKVAERLAYQWYYVEYTKEKWETIINGPIFELYLCYGSNLKAVAHIQDLLAINELKRKGLVPDNTVVVPGHTGDVLGGSQFFRHVTVQNVTQKMYDKYFELNILKRDFYQEMLGYIRQTLESYCSMTDEETCLRACNLWNIKNRQANFIVNSVRAYELNEWKWYLPLWDDEFEQYWNAIPCKMRIGSQLYQQYLFKSYFEPFRVDFYKSKNDTNLSYFTYLLRCVFSARTRYLIKRMFADVGLYSFPKDYNALDQVGEMIAKKEFDKENVYVQCMKMNSSMCMKALYYLYLIQRKSN